jgi:AcrR family transcriptional regulator
MIVRHQHEEGTRPLIQAVALELFAVHGYERTSLREIAEVLGITKAALYYHFRTKEDILASLTDVLIEGMDHILDAPALQRRGGRRTRRQLLECYLDLLLDHRQLMTLLHNNQPTLTKMEAGQRVRERLQRLQDLLAGPDASIADGVRAACALGALHTGWRMFPQIQGEELRGPLLSAALGALGHHR